MFCVATWSPEHISPPGAIKYILFISIKKEINEADSFSEDKWFCQSNHFAIIHMEEAKYTVIEGRSGVSWNGVW